MTAREPAERPPSAGEVASRAAALALDPWDPRAATTVIASRRTDAEAAQAPGPARRGCAPAARWSGRRCWSPRSPAPCSSPPGPRCTASPTCAGCRSPLPPGRCTSRGSTRSARRTSTTPAPSAARCSGRTRAPAPGPRTATVVTLELASGSVRLRPAGLVGDGYVEAAREVVELGLVPRRGRGRPGRRCGDRGGRGRRRAPDARLAGHPDGGRGSGARARAACPRWRRVRWRRPPPHPARQRRPRAPGGATARAPEHHAPKADGKKHDHQQAAKPEKSGNGARDARQEVSRAGRGRFRRPRAPGRTSPGSP